mgnify:CR=1 FL=1
MPPPTPPTLIAGSRVHLRHPCEADRRAWVTLRSASRDFLERWEPKRPASIDGFGSTGFDLYKHNADTDRQQRHLIIRTADDTLLGHVGINEIARGPFQNGILGYWIGEAFAQQGYMTEAIRLVLQRGFGDLGLHRIEANIMPANTASKAVIAKCGFRLEGVSPRYLQIAGVWADHERYAITAEEVPQLPRR